MAGDCFRVATVRPDAVIHCAAIVGVRASLDMPMQTMRVNVKGRLNVLEAMRHFGVRRMIHKTVLATHGGFIELLVRLNDKVEADNGSPFSATGSEKSSRNIPAASMARSWPAAPTQHQNRATCW